MSDSGTSWNESESCHVHKNTTRRSVVFIRDDGRRWKGWNDSPSTISWTLPTQAFAPQNVLKRACSVLVSRLALVVARTALASAIVHQRAMSVRAMLAKVEVLNFLGGFCEVKLLLKRLGKNPPKASYWSLKAKRRHFWTDADLTQEPRGTRGRKRAGGIEKWMARKRVLKKMCEDIGTE